IAADTQARLAERLAQRRRELDRRSGPTASRLAALERFVVELGLDDAAERYLDTQMRSHERIVGDELSAAHAAYIGEPE
ncbi:MAG TPA: hypothetical protein VH391_09670, partial [Solirubrobacterales bacterium]